MSATWRDNAPSPEHPPIGPLGWMLALVRGLALAVLIFGGLLVLLILRMVERPAFGMARPITPSITVFVCQNALRIMRLRVNISGAPMSGQGALVANHSSWLDIIVLNACSRVYFVSKSDVASWPGIGWLARATGTVFVERRRSKVAEQSLAFQTRLKAGHRLLFFPEGTSSDGQRVLPFKSSLFAAFLTPELGDMLELQPVSVRYHAPPGADPRFYGWWGDMEFGPHMLRILATPSHGSVSVNYAAPIIAADHNNRKALAALCEAQVRCGYER